MKLKEYLEKIDANKRIYLTSKSSFIFIGTKEDIGLFPSIEKDYINRFKNKIKNYKRDIELNKDRINESIDNTEIKKLKKENEILEQRIENYQNYLKEFKPLLDREILRNEDGSLDIFEKTSMPDELGVAIKIEGQESGDYWTYKEWLEQ